MNINRNNYEEYFLMYVDNELTAAERSAVDEFIELNPDLKAELKILQETVLQPEPFVFDKTALLSIPSKGINKENHEEYFVEYVNNELSASEKAATETFVLQHPELQESFTAFKATILPNEIISFKNKEILYRKESTRVIAFSFQRFAVAAAVLGIIATGIWLYPETKQATPLAEVKTENNNSSSTKQQTGTIPSTATADKTTETKSATADVFENVLKAEKSDNKVLAAADVTNKIEDRSAINTGNEENTKLAYLPAEVIANETTKTVIEGTGAVEIRNLPALELTLPASSQTAVAYTELDTEEENNNVYVGALSINKDKLKGVFRKAGRLFSSKVKPENEEGKIQVANLEIDTRKNK